MAPPEIPARGASLPSWDTYNETKLQLEQSEHEVKRKLSAAEMQNDEIKVKKLRVEKYNLQRKQSINEINYWELQAADKRCDAKTLREQRIKLQKRSSSFGDWAWDESKQLRLLEEQRGVKPVLGPDYEGGFMNVLRALYTDWKIVNDKRTSRGQSALREESIAFYRSKMDDTKDANLWCPVTNTEYVQDDMVAAHLVPRRIQAGLIEHLFGTGSYARIDTPDNCLIMYKKLEKPFDKHQIVLVPVDRDEMPLRRWKVRVIDESASNSKFDAHRRLIDLDNQELDFRGNGRPASRFLYFHFVLSIFINREEKRPGYEKAYQLMTEKPFATWGKWLRKSVMLVMARDVGDMSPEFYQVLMDEKTQFPEDDPLEEHESEEVGRRVLSQTRSVPGQVLEGEREEDATDNDDMDV